MHGFEAIEVGDGPVRLYAAGEMAPGTPGVVLLHAWWGLNGDVVAFADRLAAAGYAVAAPDLFGGTVVDTIAGAEAAAGAADEATCEAITVAAAAWLQERLGPGAPIAGIGFSFGAAWALWYPDAPNPLSATVLYYGTAGGSVLTRNRQPVLGHFAADDPYEDAGWVAEVAETMRGAGREVTFHTYPGTGHWFAEPSRDAYRPEAAELAWERTLAFLETHLGPTRG